MKSAWLALLILAVVSAPAASWEIPPDNGTMGRDAISAIVAGNDDPETSTYTQTVEFIDFSAHGQRFTQVVVTLTPSTPRLRNGKRLVVVGGEPGGEYGMDFVATVEGKEPCSIITCSRRTASRLSRAHGCATSSQAILIEGTGQDALMGKPNLGPSEPAGAKGLNARGPWSDVASYVLDDVVTDAGQTWRCLAVNCTVGVAPTLEIQDPDWELLAAKGADGTIGEQGPPGPAGTFAAGMCPSGPAV